MAGFNARTRGARQTQDAIRWMASQFQLARPRGARRGSLTSWGEVLQVSTRAPARGATHTCPKVSRRSRFDGSLSIQKMEA